MENTYGDPSKSKDLLNLFKGVSTTILQLKRLHFWEIYSTLKFQWTPDLSPNEQDIPHGFIFAIIMFPSMLGNSLAFRLLLIQQSRWMATCRLYYLSMMQGLLLPVTTIFLLEPNSKKVEAIQQEGISRFLVSMCLKPTCGFYFCQL